jgi:F0F1-type ATP synthase membrane subunit b/b'
MNKKLFLLVLLLSVVIVTGCGETAEEREARAVREAAEAQAAAANAQAVAADAQTRARQAEAEAQATAIEAQQDAADREQARQQQAVEHSQKMVQDALDRERNRQTRAVITAITPWVSLAVVLAFVAGALVVVVMMRRKVAEVEPPARSMMIGRGQAEALPAPRDEWLPMLAEPVGAETKSPS